jgi:hypothetical protein
MSKIEHSRINWLALSAIIFVWFACTDQRATRFTYNKGLLVTHWTGCVAPRYTGISNVPHTYGAEWFGEEDIQWIADQGFDHLQIDVDEQRWFSNDSSVNTKNIATYRQAVQWANQQNLGVVLTFDVHPFGEQPDPMSDSVMVMRAQQWKKIAELFGDNREGIRFHLGDNYLPANSDPEKRYHAYIDAIREADQDRFVYINVPVDVHRADSTDTWYYEGYSAWLNSAGSIDYSRFDAHTGVSLVYFFPEIFLYQHPNQRQKISFPGSVPDFKNAKQDTTFYEGYVDFARKIGNATYDATQIKDDLAKLTDRIREKAGDRELYLKQFGIHTTIDSASAANYISAVVGAARELNLSWCLYDYESGRAIRNEKGEPFPAYWGLGLRRR